MDTSCSLLKCPPSICFSCSLCLPCLLPMKQFLPLKGYQCPHQSRYLLVSAKHQSPGCQEMTGLCATAGKINLSSLHSVQHFSSKPHPKSNDRCFYMREEEGDLRHNDTWKKAMWREKLRLELCCINQEMPGATRSWKRQERFSPRGFRGSTALPRLDFRLLASKTVIE